MAEGILFDVVGRILEVLGSRAFQEIQLASGVRDEVRKLKDTVETINAVLLDAEEQYSNKNHEVTVWLGRLKDAVYDADDLLDDFAAEVKRREVMSGSQMAKEVRIFFSDANQIAYNLKMGHKIKTVRVRLDEIKNDRQFLLFKPRLEKGVNNRERDQTHSFVRQENVIGRDDDKHAIIQLLLSPNGEENVSVISIVGIGGIGKTTLVQSVYNVEMVKNHFELRIWVCISDDFNLKTIVGKILKSGTGMDLGNLEMDQLQQRLRAQLDGRKYLLVLDDIWNENPNRWSEFKDLLMNGAGGSKILVTTRSKQVAKVTSQFPFYVLRGLPEDKSWTLFTRIAFEQGREPKDSRLVTIGKDIVAKCAGVPLAIKTVGRVLYDKNTEVDWLNIRDNELSKVVQEEGDILPILKLSYDHLPSQLKHCFAYCALFPKDYKIEREQLVLLWMAQGFLHTRNKDLCVEDVGNEYFMHLLSRSFFQDLQYDGCGRITCTMHDLMHDLAQLVAGSECTMVSLDSDIVDVKTCHVSFDPDLKSLRISTTLLRADNLRTFLPLCHYLRHSEFHISKILSKFRRLRTLILSHLGMKKVPTSIGELKHLRNLNLSWNQNIEELPNSISKLINLQTLDLSFCDRLNKLPKDMKRMVSLEYLMLEGCDSLTSMPQGLGQLTSLRALPLFVVGEEDRESDSLRELNGLNKLRGRLTIEVLGRKENVKLASVNLEAKPDLVSVRLKHIKRQKIRQRELGLGAILDGLKVHPNLKDLTIFGFGFGSSMFSGFMSMSSLRNLTRITVNGGGKCQNVGPLDQLPSLKLLFFRQLYSLKYMCDRVDSSSSPTSRTTFFPSLTELTIEFCYELKGWWKINDDNDDDQVRTQVRRLPQFPCLCQLFIRGCPHLTAMPLYPTVEELTLWDTSLKPLQQTMKMKTNIAAPSTSSTFSSPLCNLKFLSLHNIDNDFESLPELLQNVTCLLRLDIMACPRTISQLSQCLEYLSSLRELKISDCDNLDSINNKDEKQCQWDGLVSLRYLQFRSVQNLVSLPNGIQHISTLKHLEIDSCTSLMSLPEGMKIKRLEIVDFPELSKRYAKKKGVDWPKIAHIPYVQISNIWIRSGASDESTCSSLSTVGEEHEQLD